MHKPPYTINFIVYSGKESIFSDDKGYWMGFRDCGMEAILRLEKSINVSHMYIRNDHTFEVEHMYKHEGFITNDSYMDIIMDDIDYDTTIICPAVDSTDLISVFNKSDKFKVGEVQKLSEVLEKL